MSLIPLTSASAGGASINLARALIGDRGTVGTSSVTLVASESNGHKVRVSNPNESAILYVNVTAAASSAHFPIRPGQVLSIDFPFSEAITIVGSAAGTLFDYLIEKCAARSDWYPHVVRTLSRSAVTLSNAGSTALIAGGSAKHIVANIPEDAFIAYGKNALADSTLVAANTMVATANPTTSNISARATTGNSPVVACLVGV